jgi:hypothetical protein
MPEQVGHDGNDDREDQDEDDDPESERGALIHGPEEETFSRRRRLERPAARRTGLGSRRNEVPAVRARRELAGGHVVPTDSEAFGHASVPMGPAPTTGNDTAFPSRRNRSGSSARPDRRCITLKNETRPLSILTVGRARPSRRVNDLPRNE